MSCIITIILMCMWKSKKIFHCLKNLCHSEEECSQPTNASDLGHFIMLRVEFSEWKLCTRVAFHSVLMKTIFCDLLICLDKWHIALVCMHTNVCYSILNTGYKQRSAYSISWRELVSFSNFISKCLHKCSESIFVHLRNMWFGNVLFVKIAIVWHSIFNAHFCLVECEKIVWKLEKWKENFRSKKTFNAFRNIIIITNWCENFIICLHLKASKHSSKYEWG